MKKYFSSIAYVSTLVSLFSVVTGYAPIALAAPLFTSNSDLSALISNIISILQKIVPLLIGAAIVVFLWGVFLFIAKSSSGNAEGRKEGINFMVFGIIGIAVMVSVWGLVTFVTTSLGTSTVVPQFNTSGTSNFNTPGAAFGPMPAN